MAQYYRVKPKYWKGDRRRWTDQEKLLGLYLLTCDHRNLEGLYWLPKAYIASDLGWSPKVVDRVLATLLEAGFCKYDPDAEVVFVPKALAHQAPSTANQIKGAVASLDGVPSSPLWDDFMATCRIESPRLADAITNRTVVALSSHADAMPVASLSDPDIARTHSSSSSSSSSSRPPQPPASGGRARDREKWKKKATDYARSVGVDGDDEALCRAVQQAATFAKVETAEEFRAFAGQHFESLTLTEVAA